jgi:hypothetical protein
LSGLRYIENSITLAELPEVYYLQARYRLLKFDLKFHERRMPYDAQYLGHICLAAVLGCR